MSNPTARADVIDDTARDALGRAQGDGMTPSGTTARILLVEDNEFNGDMLSRRLTRRGFTIVRATDGLLAVALARHERPDLILMDMSLREIDGWEATRRIKSDPITAAIPLVALTAHAMATDRERSLRAGCDEFETKPVDLPRLLTKIASLLGAAVVGG